MLSIQTVIYSVDQKEIELYNELHFSYIKWHDGLFGSRNYYQRKMYWELYEAINKIIQTPANYYWYSFDNEFHATFKYDEWLIIKARLNDKQVVEVAENDFTINKFFRSDYLLAIKGQVYKFSMDRSFKKEKVVLYLKNVEIIKNNK